MVFLDLAIDKAAFRETLEDYVPRTGFSTSGDLRILDVGCGFCLEADVLTSFFGEYFQLSDSQISFIGLDSNKEKINRDKEVYQSDGYRFVCGDARKLDDVVEGKFDVVVIRHPNIFGNEKSWKKIFKKSYKVMDPGGLLVSTCLSPMEWERVETCTTQAGYKIQVNEENVHGVYFSESKFLGGRFSHDGYVIMAVK